MPEQATRDAAATVTAGASGYAEVDPTGRYGRYDEVLGKGSSKTVYRGFDEWLGIEVAWNQVQLHDFLRSSGDLERLHLLGALRHRAVIRFHASWVDPRRRTVNFLTELFNSGTLRQYRAKHRNVSMAAVKHWCRQIVGGLAYLHGHDPPILHRDLKCDSLFVNGNKGEVKLGDLGLAAAHCVGTPEFMAPEVYEESYTELADVYSFGMCVLEMITGEYPYAECTNTAQIYKKVISGIKPQALHMVRDATARRFIAGCLAPAWRRPTATELLDDPFLKLGDGGGGGFSSSDGNGSSESDMMRSYHRAHVNGGSTASNVFSSSTAAADDDDDNDDSQYHGIELLFDEHGDGDGDGVDIRIKGRRVEDGGAFLRMRIADKDGTGLVRNIYFPFDTKNDTALSVAAEMMGELDITDHEVTRIAEMIDGEIGALVPGWLPGPAIHGVSDALDEPSTARCQNCSGESSCGSLLDFMSSAAHRGCRCVELHGRFEEITFQADEEQVDTVIQLLS